MDKRVEGKVSCNPFLVLVEVLRPHFDQNHRSFAVDGFFATLEHLQFEPLHIDLDQRDVGQSEVIETSQLHRYIFECIGDVCIFETQSARITVVVVVFGQVEHFRFVLIAQAVIAHRYEGV